MVSTFIPTSTLPRLDWLEFVVFKPETIQQVPNVIEWLHLVLPPALSLSFARFVITLPC